MTKTWKADPHGRQLEAFLGSRGVRTGAFETTEDLLIAAATVFEIPITTVGEMAARIASMPKRRRAELCQRNVKKLEYDTPEAVSDRVADTAMSSQMAAVKPHLVDGQRFGEEGALDLDPAKLLAKVVSSVISAGRADLLAEHPDVLAYYGSRRPTVTDLAEHQGFRPEDHQPAGEFRRDGRVLRYWLAR